MRLQRLFSRMEVDFLPPKTERPPIAGESFGRHDKDIDIELDRLVDVIHGQHPMIEPIDFHRIFL